MLAYQAAWSCQLYDFDFASPLPGEDPQPLVEAIKNYLTGQGGDPCLRQARQLERRSQLRGEITRRLDPLRRKWFNEALDNALARNPLREDSIAGMGLSFMLLRRVFAELGQRLVQAGGLECSENIYWLRYAELEQAASALEQNRPMPELKAAIKARKALNLRLRKFSPPTMLPRNSALARFMPPDESAQSDPNALKGVGASGGCVTAPACVLFGPQDFASMRPGDVLVAVTTTPAWTPLFGLASAVVTDIGGPLSHSSIVAREYGIPAVMATGTATRRIHNGQMLTVDGDKGTVKFI
jgi:pyruvate,water dikinase